MRFKAITLSALALTPAPFAYASPLIVEQQRIDQTSAQPAQIEGLRGRSGEVDTPAPFIAPAPVTPPPPAPDAPLAQLHAVQVTGSSLASEQLREVWWPRRGATLDSATISAVADAISALYRTSDIALYSVIVPDQDLSAGVLEVRVVEGHITNVIIQTDDADAPDVRLARSYAAHLTSEAPLRRSTLERTMSLIQVMPGERVEASLTPAEETGGAQLTLAMRRNRADVGFSISTRGTPLLGRTQASADISLNGMFRGGDRTDIAVTIPLDTDAFRYAAVAYTTPIGNDGLSATANVSSMHTEPEGLGVEGEATAAGVSVTYPIVRTFTRSLNASIGVDALDTENALVGQVVDTNRTRAVRAGLSFSDANSVRALSASTFLSLGVDGLGARVDPLFAEADFNKFALQVSWSRLYADYFALRLNAQLQTSPSLLPASEQMALGGDAYGRAFPSAIVQGDQGLAGSAEFAVLAPDSFLPAYFRGTEIYTFYDGGRVRTHARPLLPQHEEELSSFGFGSRIALGQRLLFGAELARAAESPSDYSDDDWRFVYTLIGRR